MPKLTTPLLSTTDFTYIRFHGREGLYSSRYTDEEMADWAKRISEHADEVESVYIYFNNDANGWAIKNAIKLKEILREEIYA